MQNAIEQAVALAEHDAARIAEGVRYARMAAMTQPEGDRTLLVDGSQYAPSWRALYGGAEVWKSFDGADGGSDALQAYEEELDRATNDLGAYWEDGCLFYDAGGDDE